MGRNGTRWRALGVGALLVALVLGGCGAGGKFTSAKEKMEKQYGHKIQVDATGRIQRGYVYMWKSDEERELGKQMDSALASLRKSASVVSVATYQEGQFREFADKLRKLSEGEISIYFEAKKYLTGFMIGDELLVKKSDEAKSRELLR